MGPDAERTAAACPRPVEPNDSAGWIGRDPTIDEQEIVQWMRRRPPSRRILHVGIGNCLLSHAFGAAVAQGISKDGKEIERAAAIGLDAILCNKYAVDTYASRLQSDFDCIVDPNIRSYACCDRHFSDYMALLHRSLIQDGYVLTSKRGLDYLVPTTVAQLRQLCPDWHVREEGNVVIMHRDKAAPGGWRRLFKR